MINIFQFGVREATETESQMTSVERVLEYCDLQPEAALETDPGSRPGDGWPNHGKGSFEQKNIGFGVPPVRTIVFKHSMK